MDAANEPLTEAHWQQIEHLFLEAVARPPEKRAAFLATACAGDPVLNEEVAAMLAAHEEAGDDYLEALDPDCAAALLQKPDTEPAEVIGPYRLVEELGRGGMGTVYLAERADGQFEQRVALKLIKRGMDSEAVLQRFLAERQILARLQHPNVARLLDGGITDDGRPYFAMEHVAGRPITQYCDEGRLSVEARLRLFAGVCQAVQYAHRNLIVHRDLKPSNILVTDDGQVKLLDFGIGKMLGSETDAQPPTLTEAGLRAMTPEYAAPEQVRGEAVTTATDVYSLGVVLYELLAGRRPYAFVRRTPDAVARVLFDTEPERPSTAISRTGEAAKVFWDTEETICRRRATTAAALRRRLAGDLDTVVLKALRKEPDRRYASAEAFVEDIKRHLAGLPVTARKDTWSYRAKKFVQRNRVGVAVGGGLVILLVAFLRIYTHAITEEKSAAQHAARRASLMAGVMQDLLEGADPYAWGAQRGDSLFLTLGQQKVMTDLAGEPDLQVRLLTTLGTVHRRRGQYNEARRVLDQALAIARTTYDAPHPSLTQVLNEMGYYYSAIGAYAQAEPFYREALALQRQVFGEDHPEVLQSMTTLAQLRWLEGYTAEAEIMLREIVALGREAHGTSDPAYLPSLWKLARVLFIRGKFGESEQRFLEILALRRAQFGEQHRTVASTLQWIGLVLTDKGDFAASEAYLHEALIMQRRLLGEEHEDIAVSLFGLGLLEKEQARYEEAVPYLEQSIAMTRRVFGDNHKDAAFRMHILGEVYRLMGRYEQAETVLRHTLRINREVLGANHVQVGETLVSLGRTLSDAGRYEEAEARFEEALAIFQRDGAFRRRGRLEALTGYGALLTRTGRAAEAEPLLREAVSTLTERIAAPYSRYVLYARAALGACLAAQQRYAEAEPLVVDLYAIHHDHYGPDDPRTRQALADLIALYDAWEKPEEAARYRAVQ